ncbi:MAG: HAD family hydrolase [Actinomycetota bacterium]
MSASFDAVLLDLYDTIVWSDWRRLRDMITSHVPVDDGRLQAAFDTTRALRGVGAFPDAEGDMAAVLEAAGVAPDPELVRKLTRQEVEHLSRGVHLYDDVLPTVEALRARGVKTALVSNCSHSTRPVVDRLGLEGAFDRVILSFEVRAMKPDAAIYQVALAALGGVEPSCAVFVDDQTPYCDGAAAVGMATALIERPNEYPSADVHGHRVVTDLGFLL